MLENLSIPMNLIFYGFATGIGATAIMDIWGLLLKFAFNITGLNISMVGRWIGHIAKGRLMHQGIANSPAISGEVIIGWIAHYAIGVIFALVLMLIWGTSWAENPSMMPALIVGITTVMFPFVLMQPSFGMGIAANKLPDRHTIQLKSIAAHFAFGLGLYISALLIKKIDEAYTIWALADIST